jgi:transposase
MRGEVRDQDGLFSYIDPESRIPADHPLRQVRGLVRAVLKDLSGSFSRLYSHEGRPSIPPEQLLSALLLQVLYGLRSERLLMEQLDYNLLFRWFVGLSPDDRVWDATSFTKNRERLQQGQVFDKFMVKLLEQPEVKPLLSDEHFSVDGTLIEAWASHKSFKPKDADKDDDGSNFHGQKRKNDSHASTSDPDAKLYRKAAGREARLSYMGHAVMENRNGLAVAGTVSQADGTAERRAAEALLKRKARRRGRRITVGEDKAYDSRDHVTALRRLNVTPHVAQNDALTKTGRRRTSAIDKRTTRHVGYRISQSCRAMVECIFGWGKQHGTMRKTKHRGIAAVAGDFMLNLIAYNLVRIPKLIAA